MEGTEGIAAGLFRLGDFTLASGRKSRWKIDCDTLDEDDWATLAMLAFLLLPNFGSVEGVPAGGLAFARKLERYCMPGAPVLIADDVLTTGDSMERQRACRDALGVVAFSRGPCPGWITPLFTLNDRLCVDR